VITAAALCPAPPLLVRQLTGGDPVVPELRQACTDAVAGLVLSSPDLIAVVGAGMRTREWHAGRRLNLADFAPGLRPAVQDDSAGLPLAVGLGARLLDQAGYTGLRMLQSVGEDEPADRCAGIGAQIARSGQRVALLAMADGSARRGPRAPGYFDDRSHPFDAEVEHAVRTGDLRALLALDQNLARELMATGRPCWQVLAGALHGTRPSAEIRYCDDPFGVAYLVASFTVPPSAIQAGSVI
jgi:hypothetical protein